jgi:hypothetical protein
MSNKMSHTISLLQPTMCSSGKTLSHARKSPGRPYDIIIWTYNIVYAHNAAHCMSNVVSDSYADVVCQDLLCRTCVTLDSNARLSRIPRNHIMSGLENEGDETDGGPAAADCVAGAAVAAGAGTASGVARVEADAAASPAMADKD